MQRILFGSLVVFLCGIGLIVHAQSDHTGLLGEEAIRGQLIVKYKDDFLASTLVNARGGQLAQQLIPTAQ